jgi:1,4-alpha-glucan branching enzyme
VHFTGNGFEGMGFAAAAQARAIGAAFSVWPAIHAGSWGDGPLDAELYRAADAVFCLSQTERAIVMSLGVAPDRTVLTPLGPLHAEPGAGARFRRIHAMGDAPAVLFLSRRDPYKGLDALVNAVRLARASVPDARLIVAGPPGLAGTSGLDEPWIVDLGSTDEGTTADVLDAVDIVSVPSSAEALGIVVLDAWAHSKPVVVGPSPASRELVSRGGGGFAVEQEPGTIAEALTLLWQDRRLAARLGEAGHSFQQRSYTWAATVDVHLATWHRAMALSTGRSPPHDPGPESNSTNLGASRP